MSNVPAWSTAPVPLGRWALPVLLALLVKQVRKVLLEKPALHLLQLRPRLLRRARLNQIACKIR